MERLTSRLALLVPLTRETFRCSRSESLDWTSLGELLSNINENINIHLFCFSSILTLGPSFQVNAQAKAALDLDVALSIGINYKIDNAELVFPPNGKQASKGAFNVADTRTCLLAFPPFCSIDSYLLF